MRKDYVSFTPQMTMPPCQQCHATLLREMAICEFYVLLPRLWGEGEGEGGWRHVPGTMVRRPRLSRAPVFLSPSTHPQAELWEQDLCPRTIQNWMKPFWLAVAR